MNASAPELPSAKPAHAPSMLRILLIEDSRSEALYIERTLTQASPFGFDVRQAQTLNAALEALEKPDFDVVLLDLGLPDTEGFSGLHAIQNVAPKIPVVILTGTDDRDMELKALEQGAQDYLLKDRASVNALNRTMRHAIQRKQVESLKSEFVSLVSHELRTPLTSIHGALGLITGALANEVPDQVLGLIQIAHKNSERLIRLVNDILDIDKIDSGRMYFDIQMEAVAPILQHAVDTNQVFAATRGVQFRLQPVPADIYVRIDASRLTQVIANLLSNAAKFSHPGTEVIVWAVRQAGRVRVAVTDRGVGIPPEYRDRIFSKFTQADSAIKRQASGAGLGLYICKQIVEHMGGNIDFESEPGRGSTFWVDLPDMTATVRGGGDQRQAS